DALQYMADRHLGGKLIVHFDWAQYALAALAPETTVAFDGRLRTCYPQEVADLYFDFLIGNQPACRWRSPTSPPFDDTALVRRPPAPPYRAPAGGGDATPRPGEHRHGELAPRPARRARELGERLREDRSGPGGRDAAAPQGLVLRSGAHEQGRKDEERQIVEG